MLRVSAGKGTNSTVMPDKPTITLFFWGRDSVPVKSQKILLYSAMLVRGFES